MKKLLAISFAVSCLLRPDFVLCLEPTGDVRLEFSEAFCCESNGTADDESIRDQPAGDCDGCVDVALATHSLLHKRSSHAPALTSTAFVLPAAPASIDAATVLDPHATSAPARAACISTTVIRR